MRQKDKKLKELLMQVEDERKQAEQYKDQVRSLSTAMLICSQTTNVDVVERMAIWSPVHGDS